MRAGVARIPGCTLTGSTDPETTCGLTAVAIDGWEPRQVVDALWERYKIAVRAVNSPAAIRISTAHFNTEAEVDRVLEALQTIASEEAPPIEAVAAH